MNKKNKLLIIDLGKAYGGMEKQIESILMGLENEFDITLAINSNGEFVKKSKCIKKYNIIKINNSVRLFCKTILTIIKYVRQENISVVHCNGTPANIIGIILKKALGIKFISAVHSDILYEFNGIKRFIYKFIEGITAKYANNVVVVSNNLKYKLISRYKKYSSKFIVIYNGVTFEKEKIKTIKDNHKFKMLFVGRLVEIKNIEYLLESIQQIKDSNFEFECNIIGDGELKKKLIESSCQKKIKSYINFLGFKDNIQEYMVNSDLLVMTSKMEGIPLVIIEAFANKLPVVSSSVGGICEMIENNYNGLLFDLNNTEGLSQIFLDIFNNKYDLNKIKENAYKEYKNKWTREVMVEEYKKLYIN